MQIISGITVDQCSLNAESFSKKPTCEENSEIGLNKSDVDTNLPTLDIFLNKTKRANLDLMEAVMRNITRSTFPMDEIGKNFTSLFNLLWNSNLPCFNSSKTNIFLLQKCSLYGKEEDCSKLFKPILTASGICCSFNHKTILRDSEYRKLLKIKQNMNPEDEALYHAEINVGKGLQIFVDQHSNRVTAGSVMSSSK